MARRRHRHDHLALTPPHPPPAKPELDWKSKAAHREKTTAAIIAPIFAFALGVGVGAQAADDSNELAAANDEIVDLKTSRAETQDRADRFASERNEAWATIDGLAAQIAEYEDQQADLDARAAELDARESDLDARSGELDKREADVTAVEQAKEANSFGDGVHVVGTDIQPGVYKSDGPTDSAMGFGYWARLSGLSGTFDEIITNGTPSGPTTVEILATDAAFESSGMKSWTKVG